jgi:glycosyltransferase involved in cell wall biosynthesis
MGWMAYGRAELSLEVAIEALPPSQAFASKSASWCPCGIEVPEVHRESRRDGAPFQVLFVGSLQEGKGVLEILKTADVLKRAGQASPFRFRIVGKWFSQEFEKEARKLHRELDLADVVEFAGQLTGDDKWQAYAQADVFFFPTHYASEATPIVLMEALGSGLPLLSTQWAGIPAMLEGCPTATLLPVKSPEQYAEALLGLLRQRSRCAEWEVQSKTFYQNHYLPQRFIDRIAAAFRKASSVGDKREEAGQSFLVEEASSLSSKESDDGMLRHRLHIFAYLADQNPGHDRSFGISRMSRLVLEALQKKGGIQIDTVVSKTSQRGPENVSVNRSFPWGTRNKVVRFLTDHFHPLIPSRTVAPDIFYYPKGFLPFLSFLSRPSVVTIHDTIIQFDEDHFPDWRSRWEYCYWAMMLKHTLRRADRILTVSESSKKQILAFMERHRLPSKEIAVTYEPCMYESMPQPECPIKKNFVIHLASCEPHKMTSHLIRWWHEAEKEGRDLPMLHLIGSVPSEVSALLASSRSIVKRPFLEDEVLQVAYLEAKALILPSAIEGFGLPALEAYYLGTPVCYVKGTSVEEVLSVATQKGGFVLDDPQSLFTALDVVFHMSEEEIYDCGQKLRAAYSSEVVADKMIRVFEEVAGRR